MAEPEPKGQACQYCKGSVIVGWWREGPLFCPDCSLGVDRVSSLIAAWNAERRRALKYAGLLGQAEGERDIAREHLALVVKYYETYAREGDGVPEEHWDGLASAKAFLARPAPSRPDRDEASAHGAKP